MICKSTALCLFDQADVQQDIVANAFVDHHPVTAITPNTSMEFCITDGDAYLDLDDIQVLLHLYITKDKAFDKGSDRVSFVNMPIASVFKDVYLKIASTQLKGGYYLYPYIAYLSSFLQFHQSAKKTHKQA